MDAGADPNTVRADSFPRLAGAAVALAALVIDQASKQAALASAPALSGGVDVLPGFSLVLVHNRGVSFGILGGGGVPWWALAFLSLGIVAVLAAWLWRAERQLTAAALGLIMGGALGNVVDRWRHGAVTDFLDLYIGTHHWPAFNLADVAIVSGAAVLVLETALPRRKDCER